MLIDKDVELVAPLGVTRPDTDFYSRGLIVPCRHGRENGCLHFLPVVIPWRLLKSSLHVQFMTIRICPNKYKLALAVECVLGPIKRVEMWISKDGS